MATDVGGIKGDVSLDISQLRKAQAQVVDEFEDMQEASDEASDGLRGVDRASVKAAGGIDDIGDASARADRELRELDDATQKTDSSMESWSATLAGAAGGAAMEFADQGAEMVGELGRMQVELMKNTAEIERNAAAANVTTDAYQKLLFGFKHVRLEGNDLQEVLGTVSERAYDAIDGAQGMRDDFRSLGITVDELKGKSPAEIFKLIARRIGNAETETKAMKGATSLLGDEIATKLVPRLRENADMFTDVGERAEETGNLLTKETIQKAQEAEKAWKKMNQRGRGVAKMMMAEMLPSIRSSSEALDAMMNNVQDTEAIHNFAESWRDVATTLNTVGTSVNKVTEGVLGLKVSAETLTEFGTSFIDNTPLGLAVQGTTGAKVSDLHPFSAAAKGVTGAESETPLFGDGGGGEAPESVVSGAVAGAWSDVRGFIADANKEAQSFLSTEKDINDEAEDTTSQFKKFMTAFDHLPDPGRLEDARERLTGQSTGGRLGPKDDFRGEFDPNAGPTNPRGAILTEEEVEGRGKGAFRRAVAPSQRSRLAPTQRRKMKKARKAGLSGEKLQKYRKKLTSGTAPAIDKLVDGQEQANQAFQTGLGHVESMASQIASAAGASRDLQKGLDGAFSIAQGISKLTMLSSASNPVLAGLGAASTIIGGIAGIASAGGNDSSTGKGDDARMKQNRRRRDKQLADWIGESVAEHTDRPEETIIVADNPRRRSSSPAREMSAQDIRELGRELKREFNLNPGGT